MPTRLTLFENPISRCLAIATLLLGTGLAQAHHPHDLIDALAVSPRYSDDRTLFIANAEHLLRSRNGGVSWKELINGLDHVNAVSDIVLLPAQGSQLDIFLSTLGDGVYASTDGGDSWTKANNNLGHLGIRDLSLLRNGTLLAIDEAGGLHVSNRARDWRNARLPEGMAASALSSLPAPAQDTLWAGTRTGVVLVSRDAGNSWQHAAQLPVAAEITVIEPDISDTGGNSYFAGTSGHGLYHTSDSGRSFEPLDAGAPDAHVTSLNYSPDYADDRTLVVTTWKEAAFVSTDAGASWQQYSQGLSTDEQADTPKYYSPQFRSVRIAGFDRRTLFLAGFDGLFKSSDGGHGWEQLETLSVGLIKSLDISPPDAHRNYSLAIGTYGGGAYVSRDRGESWQIANRGLNTTRLGDIAFSPDYPRDHTLFSGSMVTLLQSRDDGASWEKTRLGYNPWRKRIVSKLMRWGLPRDIGEKFLEHRDNQPVYPNVIGLSPDFSRDRQVLFGTRYHGLYRMQADTREFTPVWEDAPAAITDLVFSPGFAHDRTAFLFVRGDSLYKSTDGAQSWRRISQGLPFERAHTDHAELFTANDFSLAFSPSFTEDRTLYGGGPMGLFKSTDAGESWQAIVNATLGSTPNVQALAVAPDADLMVVSIKGRGLFYSQDGGSRFEPYANALIADNQSIELLAFSPAFDHDSTLYAASDQGLFRSTDRGANWKALSRPVRYEDRRDAIHYRGQWRAQENDRFSASTIHTSSDAGARAWLDFDGCGIRWWSTKSPQGGTAVVYIDASPVRRVELRAETLQPIAEVFTEHALDCGPHRIAIEVSGADGASTGQVALDAFDVLPAD